MQHDKALVVVANDVLDSARAIRELEQERDSLRDELSAAHQEIAHLREQVKDERFQLARMGSELAAVSGELRSYRAREARERAYQQAHQQQMAMQQAQSMQQVNSLTQVYDQMQAQMQLQVLGAQNVHQLNHISEDMSYRVCNCIPDRASFLRRVADILR